MQLIEISFYDNGERIKIPQPPMKIDPQKTYAVVVPYDEKKVYYEDASIREVERKEE